MGRSIGVNEILNKKYKILDIPEKWQKALGKISDPFKWLIFGNRKNGKTTMLLEFCQELSLQYKTYYNSSEEGDSLTIQEAMIRTAFNEKNVGKFILGDRDTYKEMIEKLKKNHAKIVVIDSRDYIKLTTEQLKQLYKLFPKKCFIIICWEDRGEPKGAYAQEMVYMVDMITHVADHIATTDGRFGSQLTHDIWPEKKRGKHRAPDLFNS